MQLQMDRRSSITQWDLELMLWDETAEPKALPLSLLEDITYGFMDEQEIGRGGFAVVYKGKLVNGTVAVKRMSNTYMYEKEFQREVECLMMVKHKNVVRFLGYCSDTQGSVEKYERKFVMADVQQRLLCFEYLPKGSLHDYITDTSCGLRWRDRYQIITGICQGLHYLHQQKIVHFDLKPANILLDHNLVPKITDFGISRFFDETQSMVITKILGTHGYLAPESFNHSGVRNKHSYRLDIYSLGVVITEILTGKKGYHAVDDVVESWSDMVEESHSKVQLEQVRLCAEIGIECTNFDPSKRPDTQHIISRLAETDNVDDIETGMITSQQERSLPPPHPLPNLQSAKALVHVRKSSQYMGMEAVTGAMGNLLPMLADLLTEEYNLQRNTRGEIRFLKAQLESMETALIKVSEAPLDQPPDIQVKLWAGNIKDLSYEIEDSVDRFCMELECRQQNKPHTFSDFIHICMDMQTKGKIRHNISVDIKDIKSRIKEISERREYKVGYVAPKPTGTSTDAHRLLALFQKASELIGTEEKSLDIVRMLTEGDDVFKRQLKMVSIVGFGGLGKTTLANLVYEKLRVDFDCWAFVSMSLNPNMAKVFKSLLHQLDKGKYNKIMDESSWSEIQLIREIRNFLTNKRYFILIDNICDKSVWKNIRCALIENDCGSRIIATTHILDVAKEVGDVYQLKPLSASDSRRLFNKRIFGAEDMCPPQLAEVSNKILQKCGGVPLAITTLASMLAGRKGHEDTYTYWSKVYKSIGPGLENNPDLKHMRRILYLSYYELPPNLKACLLYLSLYPEDCSIETKELIWKWIGEGFVCEEQGKGLYEVGEAYFDELINKSLIQPLDIDIDNKVSTCRVNGMVLELITSLSNEENFLTTLCGQQPRSLPRKVRRLSLPTSKEEDVKQMPTMSFSSVRSLTVFSTALSLLSTLSGFHALRTLDLSGCAQVGNHHMMDICNLLHLRYLSIKGTCITEIPKEIGNLQLLQVLNISTLIKRLPSTFVQLRQLVLVDMGDRSLSTSLLRSMSSVSSLSSLAIGLEKLSEENLQVLGSMPSLRDLSINVLIAIEDGEKRLVIDNGCPFRCLTRLHIQTVAIDFVFTQGTLQMLKILKLDFNLEETTYQFGDFHFGLENLYSLQHVYVVARGPGVTEVISNALQNGFQEVLDINPNKPTLTVKTLTMEGDWMRKLIRRLRRGELSIEK